MTSSQDQAESTPEPSAPEPSAPSAPEPSVENDPSSGQAPTPAPAPTPTPTPPPAPVERRPQPQFGEYAPEGWDWKPEGETEAAAAAATGGPVPATLPGVPHNLGAGSALPPRGGAATATRQASPGAQPQAPHAHHHSAVGAAGAARAGAKPRNTADTVISIILLIIGLIGAGQFSFAMFGIERTFALLGNAPGIDEFTSPAWLGTVGPALGLAVLAIYGVMAVYTIRRLRAGKISFWVPLATGVVMSIVVLGTVFVAMLSSPGLASIITDPEQSAKLMEFIRSMGS